MFDYIGKLHRNLPFMQAFYVIRLTIQNWMLSRKLLQNARDQGIHEQRMATLLYALDLNPSLAAITT